MANSVDPDQTAPIGAVCSGSNLFASILNWSVMLGNYLQQTTFSDAFFLGALRVNSYFSRTFARPTRQITISKDCQYGCWGECQPTEALQTCFSESNYCKYTVHLVLLINFAGYRRINQGICCFLWDDFLCEFIPFLIEV